MPTVPKLNLGALSPSGGADAIQFGSRVFQCLQAQGVSYRNTPDMTDKVRQLAQLCSKAGHVFQGIAGPKAPQCVIANAICQGSPAPICPTNLRSAPSRHQRAVHQLQLGSRMAAIVCGTNELVLMGAERTVVRATQSASITWARSNSCRRR